MADLQPFRNSQLVSPVQRTGKVARGYMPVKVVCFYSRLVTSSEKLLAIAKKNISKAIN
ncbi:hypothetical protein [Pseudanabaena sp. SR411]|uniref:hypothetical protein n=1 Tax=Pseudanabaena sp. SR411 TaxID=1980935 RepID=UPI0015957617|nr:hypothetical protein [Pseudanabaena sp. SR411]